jgi:uncharacterized membrane protein
VEIAMHVLLGVSALLIAGLAVWLAYRIIAGGARDAGDTET